MCGGEPNAVPKTNPRSWWWRECGTTMSPCARANGRGANTPIREYPSNVGLVRRRESLGAPKRVVRGVLGELERVQGGKRHHRRGVRTRFLGRSSSRSTTSHHPSFGKAIPTGKAIHEGRSSQAQEAKPKANQAPKPKFKPSGVQSKKRKKVPSPDDDGNESSPILTDGSEDSEDSPVPLKPPPTEKSKVKQKGKKP